MKYASGIFIFGEVAVGQNGTMAAAESMQMRKLLLVAGVVGALCLTGLWLRPKPQSSWSVLETSSEFTLYSLRPEDSQDEKTPVTVETFQDFPVFPVYGKTVITDPKVKAELLSALKRGIEENKGWAAACFEPRHAIRAIQGGRTVDAVICFACSQIYMDGEKLLVTASPQKVFDRVLREAKVPLGERH